MTRDADECLAADCDRQPFLRGYCRPHYKRWRRHGDPLAGGTPLGFTLIERIMRKVNQSGQCWIWTGATSRTGYGVISRGRRGDGFVRVHVAAYEHAYGPIVNAGAVVHHTCRARACVNPGHLVLIESQGKHIAVHNASRR